MTASALLAPRERILHAALRLLEAGGQEGVSTRAVSAAAGVQPPTIYRHFGDMQGLLDAVAIEGFAAYLRAKTAQPPQRDAVAQLRTGWNTHVDFGLSHPHLYALMYAAPRFGAQVPAAQEGAAMLRQLMQRVAQSGRLAVGVDRAAELMHAAGVGTVLSLLAAQERDPDFSDLMREAVLKAILGPETGGMTEVGSVQQQAAAHAVALVALLPSLPTPFSAAEQALLVEWLRQLI